MTDRTTVVRLRWQGLCAAAAGRAPDFASIRAAAAAGAGGDERLRRLGHLADLALCLALDHTAVVPRRVPGPEGWDLIP